MILVEEKHQLNDLADFAIQIRAENSWDTVSVLPNSGHAVQHAIYSKFMYRFTKAKLCRQNWIQRCIHGARAPTKWRKYANKIINCLPIANYWLPIIHKKMRTMKTQPPPRSKNYPCKTLPLSTRYYQPINSYKIRFSFFSPWYLYTYYFSPDVWVFFCQKEETRQSLGLGAQKS